MELTPVKVESYSGYKADEFPKCFYLNDAKYEIEEITDRWYQIESSNSGFPPADYFKVTADSGNTFIIKHDLEHEKWFLCR